MNIWVNGCFDILHMGHINLFWFAKHYQIKNIDCLDNIDENILYVGVDSDERVKFLKGNKRPINNLHDRVMMLSSLKMIDSVVIFNNEDELRYFIKELDIDYIIIGSHYENKIIIGSEYAKKGVVYYPVDNRSTTNLIKKIKNL